MKRLLLLCVPFLAAGAFAAKADNWPQWRGPENNGVSKETKLPFEWSEDKNIAWKIPLPPGKSGSTPVIWGDNIFLTAVEGKDIVLWCLGTDSKLRWKAKLGAIGAIHVKQDETNEASISPSTDGKHVYAMDGSGDFVCFDFNGKEVWRYNVVGRYGKFRNNHGLHTTPLLDGDRLYLALLHYEGQWVIAVDKYTGKDVWKVARASAAKGENTNAYTCPVLWQNAKEPCLVITGSDNVTGHRLSDGAELWRLHCDQGKRTDIRVIPTAVATPELVLAPTARNEGPLYAIKPGASGLINPDGPFIQWHKNVASDVPSPLAHDGLVYICKAERGQVTCMELKTGAILYKEDLQEHPGKYRASPVYGDGKIYATSHDGYVTVFKAGRTFKQLADNKLDDNFSASPAIANGRIYMRGWGARPHLYAIESSKK